MIYPFPEFSPEALAAFSDREFDAARDLDRFLESLGQASGRVCTIRQAHGDKVIAASGPFKDAEADGLVTKERGLALTIRTADCAPVFFLDRKNRAIGVCHAGWRGAQKGIVARTVELLRCHFGVKTENLLVGIGPAICGKCYEVGAEFERHFPGHIRREGEKIFFELGTELERQLKGLGILEDAIVKSEICTACSVDRFFSARREGQETGRLISMILLK